MELWGYSKDNIVQKTRKVKKDQDIRVGNLRLPDL